MQFRPSLFMTVVAVACCAVTVSLGLWQTRRATEKEALQARRDAFATDAAVWLTAQQVSADAHALRRVAARGEYAHRYTILLDNRVYRGRVGYEVVSPLRIAGSEMHVLVNRGWVPAGRTREQLPQIATPAGEQTIEGIAVVPSTRVYELARDVPKTGVWQNLMLDRYRSWSGLELQPVVIQQTNDAADGLVRDWQRRDIGAARHRGYALQWFSLSLLTVVLYVALNLEPGAGNA
jgi:surfeit locus 1 family protein